MEPENMQKTFVLDTNVLLHNAEAVTSFQDNHVVLPMAVIEELDRFKSRSDELGRNSRQVVRTLDSLRVNGNLGEGVSLNEEGGTLRIITGAKIDSKILDVDIPDNRIIKVAYYLHQQGENVIFVSKDINARLKADAVGLEAMDFEKQKVNFDELYSGYREIEVSKDIIDNFFEENQITLDTNAILFPNEFVLLRDNTNEKHTALARVSDSSRNLIHLNPKFEKSWRVKPRSKEQRMSLELLMDPSVEIVTLVGQAGTGKTLLALACGLESTLRNQRYDKILVSRPIIPLGKDIGYLPGSKDEKLGHWMQPIFDNLTFLMRGGGSGTNGNGNGNGNSKNGGMYSVQKEVDEMQAKGYIELEAMTYIRGRSIPRQYVIVDEAQNLTPHEVKTIISRAGEGTKMVLTGDPYQIDNPYLDSSSNGLTYAAERLKGEKLHGHVTLRKSERSALAAAAADLL